MKRRRYPKQSAAAKTELFPALIRYLLFGPGSPRGEDEEADVANRFRIFMMSDADRAAAWETHREFLEQEFVRRGGVGQPFAARYYVNGRPHWIRTPQGDAQ